MKDKELILEEIDSSHTLGGTGYIRFVYYESLKRELKTKPIYEFRFDERLKTEVEESTRLACTLLYYWKLFRKGKKYLEKFHQLPPEATQMTQRQGVVNVYECTLCSLELVWETSPCVRIW